VNRRPPVLAGNVQMLVNIGAEAVKEAYVKMPYLAFCSLNVRLLHINTLYDQSALGVNNGICTQREIFGTIGFA
jgi:hypothetical protein